MSNFTVSRETTQGRDELWAVLADFPNIADWTAGLTASHATSERTSGVGAQRHCDLSSGGTLEETVREWDEGHTLTISIDEVTKVPLKRATSTFRIDKSAKGHTITMETDFTPKGGPFGRLLGPVLKPLLKKGNGGLLKEWEAAADSLRGSDTLG